MPSDNGDERLDNDSCISSLRVALWELKLEVQTNFNVNSQMHTLQLQGRR
jgi:hypothetical protein